MATDLTRRILRLLGLQDEEFTYLMQHSDGFPKKYETIETLLLQMQGFIDIEVTRSFDIKKNFCVPKFQFTLSSIDFITTVLYPEKEKCVITLSVYEGVGAIRWNADVLDVLAIFAVGVADRKEEFAKNSYIIKI